MPTRDIRTRFRLEGEKEYKNAMADSARAIRMLNAEQKLAQAEFEATGDAQQYAAESARILQAKIKEQEKAFNAAKAAIAELQSKGVDPASKVFQDWNKKLLDAQTKLTEFRNDLADEKAGKFDKAKEIVANVIEGFKDVIRWSVKAGKAVWDFGKGAGRWADDLKTAAEKSQLDVETFQAWSYASEYVDTQVDDIVKAREKLRKKLNESNKEDMYIFNQLNIPNLKNNMDVQEADKFFWNVIDRLHAMQDLEQRSVMAQKLFGNEYQNLLPLINEGRETYEKYVAEGYKYAVVSKENVDAISGIDESLTRLNSVVQKVEMDAFSSFAGTFQSVGNALAEAFGALDEFIQSEEAQSILNQLSDSLEGIIKGFLGDDNGKESFTKIVEAGKQAVTDFFGALNQIVQSAQDIIGAIGGIKSAFDFSDVHLPPFLESLLGGGEQKEEEQDTSIDLSAADRGMNRLKYRPNFYLESMPTLAFWDVVRDKVNLDDGLSNEEVEKLLDPFSGITAEQWAQLEDSIARKEAEVINGAAEKAAAEASSYKMVAPELPKEDVLGQQITTANWEELFRKDPQNDIWKQIFGNFDLDWVMQNWGQAAEYMLQIIKEKTPNGEMSTVANESGKAMDDGLAAGIQENQSVVESAAADAAAAAQTGADNTLNNGSLETIGYNASIGLANGIVSGQDEVIKAANAVAQAAQAAMASTLEIASPSKVMARLGTFTAQGFAQGIDQGLSDVKAAVARMSNAAFSTPVIAQSQAQHIAQGAHAAIGATVPPSGVSGQNIQAVIMMDKKIVGHLVAPVVNEAIGSIIQEERS